MFQIHKAMQADLQQSYFHIEFLELGYTEKEVWIALKELDKWVTPKQQPSTFKIILSILLLL
jgi:hypothetical protein